MNNRRVLIVAGGVALTTGVAAPPLLAGAAAAGLGSTTTTVADGAAATTTVAGEFVLPPGFTYLIDDTNRITVAVPSTWVDIRTTPATVDGAVAPSINAATNLDGWEATFDAPGLQYAALPFTADPRTLLDRFGLTSGCNADTVVPYDDGVFVGSWGQWTECGATDQSEWHLIVASPPDQAFTAVVIVQLTGAQDQQAFQVVLETFNVTPTATWPPSGPPSSSTTPASTVPGSTTPVVTVPPITVAPITVPPITVPPITVPPITVPSITVTPITVSVSTVPVPTPPAPTTTGLPGLGVRIVDETNFLAVTVPADWTDQNLANSRHDDGGERATITAAPDIQQYYETWESSGTHLLALPPTTEPAALLNRFAYPSICTDGGVIPFNDGRFIGQQQSWLNCDGSATRVVNVAARPLDNSFTMFIQVQQPTPDDTVFNQILASAGPVPGAVYPAPTVAAPMTPTGPVPPELLVAPPIALTSVADDEGRLSVSVPSTWTDTEIVAHLNDDASDRPRVAAAPVLDSFYSDWSAPGVQVVAYPFAADPSTLLGNLGFADQCRDGGVQTFSNGTFTGLMQTWTACGDTISRNVLLAVSPADQSVTVYVEIQLPDQDNTPLQAVLSSLQVG